MNINCKGSLLNLDQPIVMGILNLNEDSFFKGSRVNDQDQLVNKAKQMLDDGASIIDIGGMSSRPGAKIISEQEEADRVLPMLEILLAKFPEIVVSIDTIRSGIADKCLEMGASIINDISGFKFDPNLPAICHKHHAPYILMHMQGEPGSMQDQPDYKDVSLEVLDFFIKKVATLRKADVIDIILDPGFGFGKTVNHNYTLLKQMQIFKILELPILAGISRKSMITKVLNVSAPEALNGSSALHMIALQKGANILRVHDVKEAMEVVKLFTTFESVN
jgi:dihydropteroate synthase